MVKRLTTIVLAVLACAATATDALAQAQPPRDGRLLITVVDPTNAILPGATVTVVGVENATKATTIAPVNTPQTIANDPQFRDRLPWIDRDRLGADQLPFPVKLIDEEAAVPTMAPALGQHTDDVLRDVLGYDDDTIAAITTPADPST